MIKLNAKNFVIQWMRTYIFISLATNLVDIMRVVISQSHGAMMRAFLFTEASWALIYEQSSGLRSSSGTSVSAFLAFLSFTSSNRCAGTCSVLWYVVFSTGSAQHAHFHAVPKWQVYFAFDIYVCMYIYIYMYVYIYMILDACILLSLPTLLITDTLVFFNFSSGIRYRCEWWSDFIA